MTKEKIEAELRRCEAFGEFSPSARDWDVADICRSWLSIHARLQTAEFALERVAEKLLQGCEGRQYDPSWMKPRLLSAKERSGEIYEAFHIAQEHLSKYQERQNEIL